MPTRFIKESCRTSKNLQAVADFSERLFWRMLTTADDYGRCLACPAIVRANCFPLSSNISLDKVSKGLIDLQSHALLRLYAIDDREYAEFITFEKHQGKPRAKTSKYPCVPLLSARICKQLPAHVTGGPDTDTDTDSKTNPLPLLISSLSSPNPERMKHSTKRNGLHEFPDDFVLSEPMKERAVALDLNPLQEFAKFKDHHLAKGSKMKDWGAAWRKWTRNAVDYKEIRR